MRIRIRRPAAALAAALALALLPGATAAGDSPGRPPGKAGTGSGASPDTAAGAEPADSASYIAEGLRENPVWISDQIPRDVPRSAARLFERAAERTGVPTYVVVTAAPGPPGPAGVELLDELHERTGRDGLYVHYDKDAATGAVRVHGTADLTDAVAERAMLLADLELPYDAGPVLEFDRFTEILASGRAEERAGTAGARVAGHDTPDRLHPSVTDMENRGAVTGTLVTGLPLLVLTTTALVRRRRGTERPASRRRAVLVVLGTAGAGGAVAAGCWLLLGTVPPRPVAQPTGPEMAARVERVVEGLERSPLYVDPETAEALAPGDRARLRERIAGMDVPVLVAAVPMQDADESAGDGEVLAHSLHGRIGRDAVHVVADTASGTVDIASFGVDRAGLESYYLPAVARGLGSYGEDTDLAGTLDEVLRYIGTTPQGRPGPPLPPELPPAPADEDALPSLFAGDFWAGAMFTGPAAALLGVGLVAGALASFDRLQHRTATPGPLPYARNRPSTGLLRRTARREAALLSELLDGRAVGRGAGDEEGDAAAVRARHYHRLATELLEPSRGDCGDGGDGPLELLCAAVLARAGRAVLEEDPRVAVGAAGKAGAKAPGSSAGARPRYEPCRLNPLHGPALQSLRVPTPSGSRRSARVCAACAASPATASANGPRLLLHLPLGPRGELVPHQEVPGPFTWPGSAVRPDAVAQWVQERLGDAGPSPAEPGAPAVDLHK
ncbi:hypothetical protein [Streptomyces sp. HB2AG]|uniref:hypothetical protein n=1 Tax=Streptomyces sp. HB2AG TaxID=2983400 RepID=UPI0022AAF794|nr:hypothetical protein [Streptomyces sp. HB2AG]MCZ2525802.1 hypothetical protein [Streptomyces sp. HB2AG]